MVLVLWIYVEFNEWITAKTSWYWLWSSCYLALFLLQHHHLYLRSMTDSTHTRARAPAHPRTVILSGHRPLTHSHSPCPPPSDIAMYEGTAHIFFISGHHACFFKTFSFSTHFTSHIFMRNYLFISKLTDLLIKYSPARTLRSKMFFIFYFFI